MRLEGALPETAPGRRIELVLDGRSVSSQQLAGPGPIVMESKPVTLDGATADIEVRLDRDFSPGGGDQRRLGMIVSAIGFVPSPQPPAPPTRGKR